MGKQQSLLSELDAIASGGGRGGGGSPENPEAAAKRPRNSSGGRSSVAQVIDLHLKVRILTRAVMALATTLGDEQLVADLKAVLNGKA